MARVSDATAAVQGGGERGQARERRRTASLGRALTTLGFQVAGILLGLAVWQVLSLRMGADVMPSPSDVLNDITTNFIDSPYLDAHGLSAGGGYFFQILYTVRNVIIGVFLGAIIGIGLGIASIRYRIISEIAGAVMLTFGTAPIFVAAPFFLIWFGILPTAQVLIVTFYTALLLYIFAQRAASNVDPSFLEYALTLGAPRWLLVRSVYLPASVPELLGGFRVALAGAWGLEAIAELLGAERGAGFLIRFFASAFVIQGMLSLTLLLGISAVLFDRLVVFGGTYLLRWTESGRQLEL